MKMKKKGFCKEEMGESEKKKIWVSRLLNDNVIHKRKK